MAGCGALLLVLGAGVVLPGSALGEKKPDGKHPRRDAAELFFTQTNIPILSLEIPRASLDELRNTNWQKQERPVVKATLREGDTAYTNVAVHLKGSAGSFQPVDRKPGFTLHMDKYARDQTFHGLEKVSLNNSRQDRTYITDKFCREMYEKAGVPAPRENYVRVQLNGRELGLYVLTEGWDKTFLKRNYKNTKGNLYDGGFAKDITVAKQVNSGENPEDSSDLEALVLAAKEPKTSTRLALLEQHLDMEKFVTMMALDAIFWNWDGYSMNRNNYRVYHDKDHDKMVFFPHGLDQMFWKPEGPLVPAMKGVIAKAAMQIPEVRQLYLARVSDLLHGELKVETVTNRVHSLARRVRPALQAIRGEEAESYDSDLAILLSRIQIRLASLQRQMEGVKQLLKFEGSEPIKVTGWQQRAESAPHQPGTKAAGKELELEANSTQVWASTVWLEAGKYRLEGRIKTQGVVGRTDPDQTVMPERRVVNGVVRNFVSAAGNSGGAGFKVWSERKLTEGVEWDWFPFRESRNFRSRGLLPATAATSRLTGNAGWTSFTYEFELRQPIADLHIIFDLIASSGKAFLDPDTVTLRKLK